MEWTVRHTPQYRHLVVKISTMLGHDDMLRNAIEYAVDSQMYPPVEASGGHDQYYIWSL